LKILFAEKALSFFKNLNILAMRLFPSIFILVLLINASTLVFIQGTKYGVLGGNKVVYWT
jgi:hypothetical protein